MPPPMSTLIMRLSQDCCDMISISLERIGQMYVMVNSWPWDMISANVISFDSYMADSRAMPVFRLDMVAFLLRPPAFLSSPFLWLSILSTRRRSRSYLIWSCSDGSSSSFLRANCCLWMSHLPSATSLNMNLSLWKWSCMVLFVFARMSRTYVAFPDDFWKY